jgi:Protein tyrosine and serine/threonine kinase
MRKTRHPNVLMLMGVCLERPCIVTELCPKGSLVEVLARAHRQPSMAAHMGWLRRLKMAWEISKVQGPSCCAFPSNGSTLAVSLPPRLLWTVDVVGSALLCSLLTWVQTSGSWRSTHSLHAFNTAWENYGGRGLKSLCMLLARVFIWAGCGREIVGFS